MLGMPLGTLTFVIYEYIITGNPFIQFATAVSLGKQLSFPWEGFVQALRALTIDTTLINLSYHVYNLALTVAFIALLYVSYKKLKPEYTIYYALSIIIILISSNLFGITRYMLVTFPAFMALSTLDSKSRLVKYGMPVIYALFIILMAGFVFLHVTQRATLAVLYTPLF